MARKVLMYSILFEACVLFCFSIWTGNPHFQPDKLLFTANLGQVFALAAESNKAQASTSNTNFPKQLKIRKDTLIPADFESLNDVNKFPNSLKTFYGIGSNLPASGMANPGAPFSVTDALSDEKLPMKRLIVAGHRQSDGLWIVHFEYGGIAHGYMVHFLRAPSGTTQPLWRCSLNRQSPSIGDLLSKVREGSCISADR